MNSSLYPDGVLVDRSALRRTELTKAAEILRDRVDLSSRGVFSGGNISVNALDSTKIDVAIFSGFAPNGEYIESVAASTSLALDSYTLNVVNYVVAVYAEINDKLQPHESDGNTYATRSRAFYRVRIYSAANYGALVATDANLANDAKDRSLILGKVTANGAAVALTTADISLPTAYGNILTATPFRGVNIPGTMILEVSSDMPEGSGVVTYTYSGGPTYTFTWTSSTGGIGASIAPSVDSVITLKDGGGTAYIRLQVIISQLPTVAGAYTDTVVIDNMYTQDIPRLTAEDWLHRNMTGTGVITENNPHGTSLDDLAGETLGLLDEHQDVMHCNGIWKGSYSGIFGMSISTAPASGDTLVIQPPTSGDLYYVNGKKLTGLLNSTIFFTAAEFTAGHLGSLSHVGSKLYDVYVDDEEVLKVNLKLEAPYPARQVTGTWIIDTNLDHAAGTGSSLVLTVGASTLTFTFGGGTPVVLQKTLPGGDPEGQVIRLYDLSGYNWIDLYVNRSASGIDPDAILPVGLAVYTDVITVYNQLDVTQNMRIGSVAYWYGGTRGNLGWNTDVGSVPGVRHSLDHRLWGTICEDNIADSFLQDFVYATTDELHHSGVLLNRDSLDGPLVIDKNFGFEVVSGRQARIRGGNYYFKGQRSVKNASTTITFPASKTSLAYINSIGTVTYLNVTDEFTTVQNALAYLAGSSLDRNLGTQGSLSDTAFYVSDNGNYEERGVPLYVVVCDASAVTSTQDVMRNINGPVDEWSVADRSEGLAAFDSLYSAFLWAEIYTSATYFDLPRYDTVNIKLTGLSSVDLTITQPASVNVYGNRNQVSFTTVPSTGSYMWILSTGCIVDGVRCVNSVVGTHYIFQIGSTCRIENCYYNCSTYYVSFVGDTGAVTRTDVKIRYNEVVTNRYFVLSTLTGTNLGWDISGNIVTAAEYSGSTFAIRVAGGLHKIYNNIITIGTDAAPIVPTTTTTGILLYGNLTYNDSSIHNNQITMGELAGDGISLTGFCSGVSVYGNRISRYPSATTLLLPVGIVCSGTNLSLDNTTISGNIISDLPIGIAVVSITNPLNNLSIKDNTISGTTSNSCSQVRGIYVSATSAGNHSNIEITKNEIRNLTRQSANDPLSTGTTEVSAIYFKGEGFTEINNLSISDNSVRSIASTVATIGTTVEGICVVLDNYVGSPIIQGLDISRNKISGLLTDVGVNTTNRYGIYVGYSDTGAASPYLAGFSIDNNNIYIQPTSVTSGSSAIGIYLNEPNYATSSVSYGSICNNVLRIANSLTNPSAYVGNGIYVTGQGSNNRISGNNIYSDTLGIYFNLTDSEVSGNTIYTGGVGIAALYCSQTIMSQNNVKVKTVNAGLVSGSGAYSGCYCIFVPTGSPANEDFVISNSILTLVGNGSPSTIIDYSANLNINKCSYFTIEGVTTKQSYTRLTTTNYRAYHMYLYIGDLDVNRVQINNCVLDNWDGVPSTRDDYTSNALYFNSDATDPGITCSGTVSVTNNTIYWPKDVTGSSAGWRVAAGPPGGALVVRSAITGCGLANGYSYIRFIGNKVCSRIPTGASEIRSPNAYFADSPIFDFNAGAALRSNTYTIHATSLASVASSTLVPWETDNANS